MKKMYKTNKRALFLFSFCVAAALALYGLRPRLEAESANKTVAFVAEYKELASLAYQNGVKADDVWRDVSPLGVTGVAVSEYTGDELTLLSPLPFRFGAASAVCGDAASRNEPNRAALSVPSDLPYAPTAVEYITKKLPRSVVAEDGGNKIILLPGSVDEFKFSAFVPDVCALDFATANNIFVFFRPGPCSAASGEDAAAALSYLTDKYPLIKNFIPAGLIAPGYPDISPIADLMKEKGITLSQVEFVRQIGVSALAKKASPLVIPMHSLTRDEIISRNISKSAIRERFTRAAHERSVRLIMVRPYDLRMGGKLDVFKEELAAYKEAMEARGYETGLPEPLPFWGSPLAGAVACGLVFVFALWFYIARLTGTEEEKISILAAAWLFAVSFAIAGVVYKIPSAARLLGGFCGAFAAAEGALTALDSCKDKKGACVGGVLGLLITAAGGVSIASFYGTSDAALRLAPFSGVKLTLLLPVLMLLAHDLTRRVHPETVPEIVSRPALWGEIILIGVMLLALLVMTLRSDNVSNVPAFEAAFRDFMERLVGVRPRTKEFLIGYPALVLYWYLCRMGYLPRYREAVRVAAALAFCSVANTFCHFHTLLSLSVIRVLNGFTIGMIIGAACVAALHFALLPICRAQFARRVKN